MHTKKILTGGKKLSEAKKALIMIHGRGADANDILGLAKYLAVSDFALLAPEATNNTWYPQSFLAPKSLNEPWLSSALSMIKETVKEIVAAGIPESSIYFLGFSQGACLTLEYVAQNATKYGGVVAFTGGLIGDKIDRSIYKGDFAKTPVFIGTSNPDPHVPVERVNATANILSEMNASVSLKVYENMGHTINNDEILQANSLIFAASSTVNK
ncbi:alpha/beta hydrolase [Flavitalea sp.]|nr:dienelactone hydrolase family protein [Flavitalea sp.]